MVGILFSMNHLLSIVSSHMWALGPRCFSCSTITSCVPAALSFISTDSPFLYSSYLKGYIMEASPSVAGGSTGYFGLYGMLPLSLTRSWCATWFALTRHGCCWVIFLVFRLSSTHYDSCVSY